ncbi:thioesterase II family protein [Catellatospora methionotrophica]|uniref:thioesterase II family protein n=1 Tax=Catellatospora methionotrophica TaxID=121620 RepID=UPI0033D4ED42
MRDLVSTRWLPYGGTGRGVSVFCLPHAGGAARSYSGWAHQGVEFLPVELPGHGTRMAEAPVADLDLLTAQLADVVAAHTAGTGRPYALFGHSMGARLAHHVAGRLAASERPGPVCVFVSGSLPPQQPPPVDLHGLDDDLLVATLVRLGGLTAEMAAEAELMRLVLPTLRADLGLFGAARPVGIALPVPIITLAGAADPLAQPRDQEGWRAHTSRGLLRRVFDGGHFFLHDDPGPVLREIARTLAALGDLPPGPLRGRLGRSGAPVDAPDRCHGAL